MCNLGRSRGGGDFGDKNSGMNVIGLALQDESFWRFDTDVCLAAEGYTDCAERGFWVWVSGGGRLGEGFDHLWGRIRGELH